MRKLLVTTGLFLFAMLGLSQINYASTYIKVRNESKDTITVQMDDYVNMQYKVYALHPYPDKDIEATYYYPISSNKVRVTITDSTFKVLYDQFVGPEKMLVVYPGQN